MEGMGLRAELKELHRGRGVRRPDVRSWLGPRLQAILRIDSTTTDDDARSALVQLIRENTAQFPRDLRYLFLVGTGIVVDHPFLEERLAVAEQALDRSPRVLRRRLRSAEQLLADSLAQTHSRGNGPFDDQGWQWEDHQLALVLRSDARLTLRRTLRALADHRKFIHESFVIPGTLDPGSDLTFEALVGLEVLDVDHSSPNSWGVTLELPETLARGQLLETELVVTVPHARALNPFLVLAPIRTSRRARVSVDFGVPPAATTSWVIDGAIPSDVASYIHRGVPVDPRTTQIVSEEFIAPRLGLAYGVGWTWAD
ncbi:MAG TPA: hypothetical protein VGK17_02620 [Propionicimonas sp.]|jgi:hypothetical protein